MVKITLFHRGKPISYYPVSGNAFAIGTDLENDLVLAEEWARDQQLIFYTDSNGRWRVRRQGAGETTHALSDSGSRIELGEVSLGFEVEHPQEESINIAPKKTVPSNASLNWAGTSASIQLLMNETRVVAPLAAPVLITGDTGTGKELVARGLHDLSDRNRCPFVSLNCGGLTESLLEDTFFGHEKGSFTGAQASAKGVFEQAHRGTLFLDEIGELPLSHQAALLRILEDRAVRPIGSEAERLVDFRLVAATNRDLEEMVQGGTFRADLYHRINTLTLATTPLRDRPDDIVPIAARFLEEMSEELGRRTLSDEAVRCLEGYSWPGNVRELKNVLYRAAALSRKEVLRGFDFAIPSDVQQRSPFRLNTIPVNRLERFVDSFNGNVTRAAKALGVARTTLRDRINRTDPDTETLATALVDLAG